MYFGQFGYDSSTWSCNTVSDTRVIVPLIRKRRREASSIASMPTWDFRLDILPEWIVGIRHHSGEVEGDGIRSSSACMKPGVPMKTEAQTWSS